MTATQLDWNVAETHHRDDYIARGRVSHPRKVLGTEGGLKTLFLQNTQQLIELCVVKQMRRFWLKIVC